MQLSALKRLVALNAETELWWDSSPLEYAAWEQEQRITWKERPDLLAALDELGFGRPDSLIQGSTTNPPLTWSAIKADPATWDTWTREQARTITDPKALTWALYREVCRRGADMLAETHRTSGGRLGYICGQVDPRDVADRGAMVAEGRDLRALGDNMMIKMPASKEGVEGIEDLSAMGISTNATLSFSVAQMVAVAEAARAGFAKARAAGIDLSGCRSACTLMLGRMEDAPLFKQQAAALGLELSESDVRWAGVAVARKACRIYQERGYETKPLFASMRVGPALPSGTAIWHLEQLAGGDLVLTVFPNILASFMELYSDRELAPRIEEPVPAAVLDKLLQVPYFCQAYDEDAVAPEEFLALQGAELTAKGFVQSMQSVADYAAGFLA